MLSKFLLGPGTNALKVLKKRERPRQGSGVSMLLLEKMKHIPFQHSSMREDWSNSIKEILLGQWSVVPSDVRT